MNTEKLKQQLPNSIKIHQYPRRKAAVLADENDHNPIVLEDCPACHGSGKSCTRKHKGHSIIHRLHRCSQCDGTGITGELVSYFKNNAPAIKVLADENGWLRCPCCSWKFNLKDKNAWTGLRHKRCGQKLLLEISI